MERNDLVAMVIDYLRERPPAWTRRVPPKVTAKRAMELLWQATDKKRRRRIRALPKSLFVILAVLLVGCGPSETKRAAQECEAASTTTDYDLALAKCHNAVRLDPFNKRLVALKENAIERRSARDFMAMEERERRARLGRLRGPRRPAPLPAGECPTARDPQEPHTLLPHSPQEHPADARANPLQG